MNTRRLRSRLYLAAAAALAGAAAIVAAAVLMPLDRPASGGSARRVATTTGTAAPAAAGAASRPSLARFADHDLRRPLSDAAADGPAAPAGDPGAPDVRLTGTIVEPGGRAYAVFVTPEGQTQVRGVGQQAGGAAVTRMEPNVVTLERGGAAYVLRVERRAEVSGP